MIARMRIQQGSEKQNQLTGSQQDVPRLMDEGKVTIPLSAIYDTLRDAVLNDRAWVQDFQDDEITISGDFYEVLKAYQRHRRAA